MLMCTTSYLYINLGQAQELKLLYVRGYGVPGPFQGALELVKFQIQFPEGGGTLSNAVTVTPLLPNPGSEADDCLLCGPQRAE